MKPIEVMEAMMELEGLTFEEAVLSYKAREKLPASAFCGPKRSYPTNDAKHVRNAFARLSQFGGKLPEAVRKRIHACIVRKAKKFGVEHKGCSICGGKKFKETVDQAIEWFVATKLKEKSK